MFEQRTFTRVIDPRVLHLTTVFALVVAIAFAVMAPVFYFYFGYEYARGSSSAQAKVSSRSVSQIIGRNPQMWQFESLRFNEILDGHEKTEIRRLYAIDGALVTEVGNSALPGPMITTTAPVFDAGIKAGTLEITQSLRPLVERSLVVFLFSSLIGTLIFLAMRTLPLGVLRRAMDHAAFLASHDPLTKLPNRTLFNDWLDNAAIDTEHRPHPLAVLCLDLDHFKDVNDTLGHAAGDDLLKQATARIKALLEHNDFLARLGGDEFAIVQTTKDQPHHATQLASQIIAALARPFDLDGTEAYVGASVGITIQNGDEQIKAATLLKQADLALYRAKGKCRGSLQFFAEHMNQQLLIRKQLEGDLRRAIPAGQLELEFQPQINLTSGKMVGVEALLRWNHPTKGRVPPDQFVHLAEETGLIIPIGDWVIRQACAQASDWPELKFAVNVSPIQFRQGNIIETVRSALDTEGVNPNRLEIEITEGILLQNTEETIAILSELKAMGVRIAMDDFGTGYSSLNYLRRFDFDKIKIDQSFIAGLGRSTESDCIIQAVIDLGASLGMTSNAEGVETLAQARKLKQQGCKEVQGYFFGRPMPSTSIQELLVDHDWMMLAADDTPSRLTDTDPADVSRAGPFNAKG